MDIYTTSFTYPAPPISSVQHTQSPEISLSTPAQTVGSTPGSGPSVSGSGPTSATTSATVSTAPATDTAPLTGINLSPLVLAKTARSITTHDQIEKDWQAVQKLVLEITSREGCLVTVTRERIGEDVGSCPVEHSQSENDDLSIPTTIIWNFHITGAYQPVMAAKGHILRETPRSNSFTLKTSRSDVLESPFAIISPLKADVARKLEEIVSESEAEIRVIIPDDSSPVGGIVIAMTGEKGLKSHQQLKTPLEQLVTEGGKDFAHAERTDGTLDEGSRKKSFSGAVGLETERTCELIISGSTESVELAKLKILVMFDDLNGLHAESCDIDYKLHNIIAGRKRCLIQQIQEETATTIYYPTALVGVLNAPQPGSQQGRLGKSNEIWITGEFFGVQRARDMLLNVAMQKCKLVISRDTPILPRKLDWLLTEKIDEIRTIMNDNGTYIQVPSVGSQASLITVFGDHRVNIERTIRSVMALACQFYVASLWLLPMTVDVIMPQSSLNPAQMQPILKKVAHTSGAEVVFKSNCFEMYGLEKQVRAAVMMALELELVQDFRREIRLQIELANEHRDFISGKKNGKINKIMKMANVKIKFETFNDYNFLIDIAGDDRDALQGLMMLQEELPAEMSFHVPESYHKRIIGVSGRNIQKIMKLHGVYVKFSNAEEFAALGGYGDNEDNVVARTPAKNAANLDNLKQAVMEMVSPKDKDYTFESVAIPRKYHRTLLGEKSIFIHDIEQKTNSIVRFPYKETGSEIVTVFGPESQVHIATAMLLNHVPFEADLHIPFNPELPRLVASNDFVIFSERVKHDHQIAIHPPIRLSPGTEAIFKFRCQRSNVHCLDTAREALEEWLGQQNISVYAKNSSRRGDSFKNAFSHFNSKLLATGGDVDATEEGEVFANGMPRGHGENVRALFNGSGTVHVDPLSHRDPMREVWHGSNQQPPAPTRTESDHQKRDSDPIINDRLRQAIAGHGNPFSHRHPHSQPRISSNRHQSLDISQLNFSRALSSGSSVFGPMPPSPTAVNSSPNTATGPNFPHMGSHSIRTNLTGRGSYGGGSSGDIESVTQTMSNMQVSHQ
nr:cytoplasmic protein [Cryptococcus depauperatus CBS 7855]